MLLRTLLIVPVAWLSWIYATFLFAPAAGIFHDDGIYLVTARALAEGQGYRISSLPWEPAQTKYPVLFPWLLSLVWRAFPEFPANLIWLKLVPLTCAACWGWLTWRLLLRLGSSTHVALAIVALTAATSWVIFLSTTLLAETLFAALLTGALLSFVRIEQGHAHRFEGALAGALMGAALLARTAGLAPAMAGLAWLLVRRRWFAAIQYGVAVASLAAPWFIWVAGQPPDTSLDTFYSSSNYASWNLASDFFTWREKLSVVGVNVVYAISAGQYWGILRPVWLVVAVGTLLAGLVVRGLWLQRRGVVALMTASYVAMVLGWAWPPVRFLVPIIPLLLWLGWHGAGRRPALAGGIALVLFVSSAVANQELVTAVRLRGGTWFDVSRINDWHAMAAQLEWVERETPQDATIVAIHDPNYYLFTGRKALRPFNFDPLLLYYNVGARDRHPFGTAEDFRQRLLAIGADYVVATPGDGLQRVIDELRRTAPGALILTAQGPPGFEILRVDGTALERAAKSMAEGAS